MALHWAPFRIPFARRLQTMALLWWSPPFLLVYFSILLFLVLWNTATRVAVVSYLLWTFVLHSSAPRLGYRKWGAFRRLGIWRLLRDYFPCSLHKTAPLPPSRSFLLGYHPHGLLGYGAVINFGTEANSAANLFPGLNLHLITINPVFGMPVLRDMALWMGLCDSSQDTIRGLLERKGNAVVLVVGGAAEALYARPGCIDLVLKKRRGFVRLALETGAAMVPVISFGENELFSQLPNPEGSWLRSVQVRAMHIFGFSAPLFFGRGIFQYDLGLLARRHPVNTVVGAPIHCPKIAHPTAADISRYHKEYVNALIALHAKHHHAFPGGHELKLVE
eukprot:TRINITY_DN9059_c0_g1_i1.p1 TRINITY_DN9059_c0_g1~~TRINITY_DN9059_c0_g1_i1.p1  ORF type:complete len:333 (+),score=39.54 TRINITY_DN9059_c0_g1_i1:2-1000(+)